MTMMATSEIDVLPSELLKARNLDRLRSIQHLDGEYLSCCLACTDQATIEWAERHLPNYPLNYHRILRASYTSAPIPFLEWLIKERKANLWELDEPFHAVESALILQSPLEKLEWLVSQGGKVGMQAPWSAAECHFARAAMYKVGAWDTMRIMQWLYDQGSRPGRNACNFALAYSPWPRDIVVWLRNHGASMSRSAIAEIIRRPYQCQSTVQECTTLIQWLLGLGFAFDEDTCVKIGHFNYMAEMPELLCWVIAKGAPWSEDAARETLRGQSAGRLVLIETARALCLPFPDEQLVS